MITIKTKDTNEVVLTFEQWRDTLEHDTVLLDSLAMIATLQDDESICVIALMDSIMFTVYPSFDALVNDLEIHPADDVTVIDSIDIVYSKLME